VVAAGTVVAGAAAGVAAAGAVALGGVGGGAAGPHASASKPMKATPPIVSRNCRRFQLPARWPRAVISASLSGN